MTQYDQGRQRGQQGAQQEPGTGHKPWESSRQGSGNHGYPGRQQEPDEQGFSGRGDQHGGYGRQSGQPGGRYGGYVGQDPYGDRGYYNPQRGQGGADGPSHQGIYGDHQPGRAGQETQGEQDGTFDPDYHQWRNEQMRALDNDYCEWRKDRFKKFSDEFSQWRSGRSSGQSDGGKSDLANPPQDKLGSGKNK